jgi:pantoate--beta-alanine ligase
VGALQIVRTADDVRAALASWPDARVGFVPTMGAFHAGHVSLFEAARRECDAVVASLFVNPTQFGERADLEQYPRDESRDASIAERAGVDVLFAPSVETMYPVPLETWVEVGTLGRTLEGASRPGHFRGVATICLKLFQIVAPAAVYFGQKDAQQVEVIRRMIRDFNLPLALRVLPTVRDADGLARALALPRALATRDPLRARAMLEGLDVDYVTIAPFHPPVLAAAVRVGGVRLIDNVPLEDAAAPSLDGKGIEP